MEINNQNFIYKLNQKVFNIKNILFVKMYEFIYNFYHLLKIKKLCK